MDPASFLAVRVSTSKICLLLGSRSTHEPERTRCAKHPSPSHRVPRRFGGFMLCYCPQGSDTTSPCQSPSEPRPGKTGAGGGGSGYDSDGCCDVESPRGCATQRVCATALAQPGYSATNQRLMWRAWTKRVQDNHPVHGSGIASTPRPAMKRAAKWPAPSPGQRSRTVATNRNGARNEQHHWHQSTVTLRSQ
eukprot:CAMPEP_0204405036 /NCGR_PEP_ID=MMETSP0470-20130426/7073_1 /ASSEMBLY_ACC=CAM_ASM_000385 /TAXON_ID=2969 /ORGANISM="Oxyrrhis marina" /LENGTH=191 /DNA_ID=CAMNT_0051400423 /DNA_START=311 /DNA_END=886 /DNA_ORIENTATION=-